MFTVFKDGCLPANLAIKEPTAVSLTFFLESNFRDTSFLISVSGHRH